LQAPFAPRTEDNVETATFEPAMSAVPAMPPAAAQLTRDRVRRLQSALHELRECRRLIDEAFKDEAA
jgi:hypothetical protein